MPSFGNSPVILSFAILSTAVLIIDQSYINGFTRRYFTVYSKFNPKFIPDYLRLFMHIFGHKDWIHLMGNFSFILLIGPILEEKYGSFSAIVSLFNR